MSLWHCTIRMDPTAAARSGTLARICGVFSERGISIEHLDAGGGDHGGDAVVTLSFQASPALAEHLRRRLTRLAYARTIELSPPPGSST